MRYQAFQNFYTNMALITEQAQLRLSVDGKQALDELSKYEIEVKTLSSSQKLLTSEMKTYEKELEQVRAKKQKLKDSIIELRKNTSANSKEIAEATAQYAQLGKKENEIALASLRVNKTYKEQEVVLDNAKKKTDELRASQSLQLRQAASLLYEQKQLRSELTSLTFGTESYIQALKRLDEIEGELKSREELTGRKNGIGASIAQKITPEPESTSIIDEITEKFSGTLSVVTLLVGYVSLLGTVIGKAFDAAREFGTAIGGLTAITGIEKGSEDLTYYIKEAQILGDVFGESSPKIIEAIQVVGSLKAELLNTKEALIDTTEQVMVLAAASGGMLSIDDSARAVTGSLNQFGEAADQSRRYINVLAAGAKEGSSEIQQTSEAFEKAGSVLKQNNITFEQSNALVQVLAGKALYGAEAGTALRNIFSKLEVTTNKDLNPAIVGLNTALDNLAKLSPQEIVKLFGVESLVAANALIEQRQEVDRLTKAVTGTNEAYDQYAKRIDNLDGDIKKYDQAWSGIWEDLGKKYEGFFRKVTSMTTEMLNQIRYFNIEIGGDSFIKVQTFGDISKQRAIEENYKKITQKAQNDARSLMNDFANGGGSGNILQKQLAGLNSALHQAKGGISLAMDNYVKAREKNLGQEQIQEILNDKKYHEAKYNFAKVESARLISIDKASEETKKKLQEGYDKDAQDKKDKEQQRTQKIEETKQHKRVEIEAKNIQEIAKLNAEAIENDLDREIRKVEVEGENAKKAKEKELTDAEFSEVEKEKLLSAFKVAQDGRTKRAISELREKAQLEDEKKAEESAKKILDITDRITRDHLQKNITKSNEQGDNFSVFNAKASLLEFERSQELRNKDLTSEQKFLIDKHYNDLYTAAFEELLKSEKVKTLKNKQEALNDEVQLTKDNVFKHHDAKAALLNFEYAQELINADKTGKSVEGIHRKYAEKRKEIDKELWQQIGQFAVQTYSTITEGFINSQNLDAQADQINLDNQKGRRLQALDAELKAGRITQKEYDAQKLKDEVEFDKKQRAIKRKQAQADHDANVIKATQSAIQSILQTMSSVPFPFNIPLAAIQAGLAFDQVSKLAAMPIPEFFDGGYTGNGGNAPKANDGKGGFFAIMHPNELTLSNADLSTDWGRTISRIYEARSVNNSIINTTQQAAITPTTNVDQSNKIIAEALMKVSDSNDKLTETLQSGIVAKNLWTPQDVDKLSTLQQENNKTKGKSLN